MCSDEKNEKVGDFDLQALIDGELDESRKAEVRAALRADPLLRARYQVLERQKRLIIAAHTLDKSESLH